MKKILMVALLVLLLSGCNLPVQSPVLEQASANIISPVDGSQLAVDELVYIETRVTFSEGADVALLLVNDNPGSQLALDSQLTSGRSYHTWSPPEPGTYTLQVQYFGENGNISSNTITVFVGEEESQIADSNVATESPEETTAPTATVEAQTATSTNKPTSPTVEALTPPSTDEPFPSTATVSLPTAAPTNQPTDPPTGSISGFIFRDENGNGGIGPADSPLAGVKVKIAGGACPKAGIQTAITNGDGNYTFSSLPAGTYCLTVDTSSLPSIGGVWEASLENPRTVTIGSGEEIGGKNFAFEPIIQ